MAFQPSFGGLSPDWVFSSTSNVHACNDRRWFTKFTPFKSTASTRPDSPQEYVVDGVGTVDLPVKRDPNLSGEQSHHILRLTNVLYTPTSVCNVVGQPIFELAAQVSFKPTAKSAGTVIAANGKPLAYFDLTKVQNQLYCLKLSDPPVGPRLGLSKLQRNRHYIVRIVWSGIERERWENPGHGRVAQKATKQEPWAGENPYTADEKAWLVEHYGGEAEFLEACELRISSAEDRAEGRVIMRIMSTM
ncbi:hypothetical protein ACHAQJ_007979 [Trichoderma viride]